MSEPSGDGSSVARNWVFGVWPVAAMTKSVGTLRPSFSSSSKLDPSLGKPPEGTTARVPVITLL